MARESKIDAVFVRCGRTDWDDQGRVQGRTDLPLSQAGRQGAIHMIHGLAADLAKTPPAAIFCSPDEASRETADLLAEAVESRVKPLPDLVSMDLGLWEGLLESEIEHRYPSACRLWQEQPSLIHPPKGENFVDAEARIRRALSEVLEKANGKPVAFVCRPIPYAMAVCWLGGLPSGEIWKIVEDGPDVTRLQVERDRLRHLLEDLKAGA